MEFSENSEKILNRSCRNFAKLIKLEKLWENFEMKPGNY